MERIPNSSHRISRYPYPASHGTLHTGHEEAAQRKQRLTLPGLSRPRTTAVLGWSPCLLG